MNSVARHKNNKKTFWIKRLMCANRNILNIIRVRLYMYVRMHLQINAALIVPNGSDTVALGRKF